MGVDAMSDQAIIGLIVALGGGIAAIVYYLIGSIKATLDKAIDEIMDKLEEFVNALAQIREKVAERTVAMTYIEREIESIKKNCRQCNKPSK